MKKIKLALLTLAITAVSAQSFAQTATDNLDVTANVVSGCFLSALPLDFGAELNGLAVNKETSITMLCSKGVSVPLSVDMGLYGETGRNASNHLKGSKPENTNMLNYKMFSDSARTNMIGGVGRYTTITATGVQQVIPVYATLASGYKFVMPDTYSDTLTFSISY